jgi:nucleoside-diphosphate-sugar epimerase
VVRRRLTWGAGDTTVLPALVAAARSGAFAWFDGGCDPTSTTHIANACEGLRLAAERGRGGQAYFVTDGAPAELRGFLTALPRTQGVEPGERGIPTPLVEAARAAAEGASRLLRPRREPPLTRFRVRVIGEEPVGARVSVPDVVHQSQLGPG